MQVLKLTIFVYWQEYRIGNKNNKYGIPYIYDERGAEKFSMD